MDGTADLRLRWIRPENVPFPNVWHRFETSSANGERTYKIRIEDVTPDQWSQVWELFRKYFYPDEPICKCSGELSYKSDQFLNSEEENHYKYLKQNVSLIAVLDNDESSPTVIGGLMLKVLSKGDPPAFQEVIGDPDRRFEGLFDKLRENVDIFRLFESDFYLQDCGIVVHPEFRGLNVSTHLLLAMNKLSVACGIPGGIFFLSSIKSQKAAERAGFKLLSEINYCDYVDEKQRIIFPVQETKSLKLMYIKF